MGGVEILHLDLQLDEEPVLLGGQHNGDVLVGRSMTVRHLPRALGKSDFARSQNHQLVNDLLDETSWVLSSFFWSVLLVVGDVPRPRRSICQGKKARNAPPFTLGVPPV